MLTELPITRTLFAYVPLKGPWYRSTALTGQYEQRCHGMGQNAPTVDEQRAMSAGNYALCTCLFKRNSQDGETVLVTLTISSKMSFIVRVGSASTLSAQTTAGSV